MTSDARMPSTSVGSTSDELRGRVVRAFGWNITSQAVRQVTRIVYGVAIARLITPREYGLAGMALVFSSLWIVFSDLGFGAALIQRHRVTERDRSTVFWVTATIGLAMTVAGFFLAGPIAGFYRQPQVKPLFQLLSLVFVVGALGMTQSAILQRELDFRSLELRIMAALVAGAVVAVALAAAGFGAWALIGNEVTVSVVSTGLMWILSSWRPRFLFSTTTLREFGPFSANLVGKSFLDYTGRNADNILVGRFLGSAPLGAYSAAYNIMLLPVRNLVQPVQETLFPALSRMQHEPERIAAIWLRATRILAALIAPAMFGLLIVAPDFIPVVLGHKWNAAIPVVQILAGVAVLQSVTTLGLRVLTAVGQAKSLFRFSIVFNGITLAAFAVGLHWGIVGVATAYAIVNLPLQYAFVRMTARAVGTSVAKFLRSLTAVAAATIGMVAFVEATRLVLVHQGVSGPIRLVAAIAVGVITYVPLCHAYVPEVLSELRLLDVHRKQRSSVQPVTE
jgi:O-antigen/teichoic acid export membrane protein